MVLALPHFMVVQKQTILAHSSVEAEYRSLALAYAEIIWIEFLLFKLVIPHYVPRVLYNTDCETDTRTPIMSKTQNTDTAVYIKGLNMF